MNYTKIYEDIVRRGKTRNIVSDNVYYERHHIIPRCVGGEDIEDNIVILTAREHYIAHQLLIKMYPNEKKLIYAANMMTVHDSDNRSCNRRYEWLRRKFSENHPCKTSKTKDKISRTLSSYYATEEYKSIVDNRRKSKLETRTCYCGCGSTFEVNRESPRKYVTAAHAPSNGEKISKSLKETLARLTSEEMSDRMKRSFGKCDQQQRCRSISDGKKGKKTNQQEIVGRRYANMSDESFDSFLSTKSESMKTRSTRLRNKWQKIIS
jgi:hypothetical protein